MNQGKLDIVILIPQSTYKTVQNTELSRGPTMFQHRNEHTIEPMLLTARQAARILSISERTLWSLTKDRQIPAVRIGRAVRYDPGDLRRWINLVKDPQKTS